jgi:hypothetical protein
LLIIAVRLSQFLSLASIMFISRCFVILCLAASTVVSALDGQCTNGEASCVDQPADPQHLMMDLSNALGIDHAFKSQPITYPASPRLPSVTVRGTVASKPIKIGEVVTNSE